MKVRVKLFGGLKVEKKLQVTDKGDYMLDIAEGTKVIDLIEDFSLSNKPLIVVINNKICNDYNYSIQEGDNISFFPPIAGG